MNDELAKQNVGEHVFVYVLHILCTMTAAVQVCACVSQWSNTLLSESLEGRQPLIVCLEEEQQEVSSTAPRQGETNKDNC